MDSFFDFPRFYCFLNGFLWESVFRTRGDPPFLSSSSFSIIPPTSFWTKPFFPVRSSMVSHFASSSSRFICHFLCKILNLGLRVVLHAPALFSFDERGIFSHSSFHLHSSSYTTFSDSSEISTKRSYKRKIAKRRNCYETMRSCM